MSDLIDRQAAIQPEQQHGRVFKGIVVEYPSYNTYLEYEGKPYFSIKYTENGQEFIGYGTYSPEVLSEYLKEYFMPSAQSAQPTNIQDILEYLDTVLHPIISPEHWNIYSELHDMISVLSSTQQPYRQGRWIDGKCNRCGTHAPYWAMASTYYCSEYCPHCGAYMATEEEM